MAHVAAQARDGSRDRQIGARRFQRCELRLLRRALALLPQGRQVPGRDRRARRQARHLRGEVHLRRRSAAAISRRVSRRPAAGAVARLGQPPEGQGRPALVPSLSERGDQARRHPALDQAEPELEFHVRRVPFDRRAQELRCGERPFRHDLGGDQRRLRGLPRPGLARTSPGRKQQKSWWPFGKREDPDKGLLVRFDERRTSPGRPIRRPAIRSATSRRRCCARRSRPAGSATRAAASSPRIGSRDAGCRTPTSSRRSSAGSITPTGRCSTRSTITARSSRARCSRPASPAATATSRTAPKLRAPRRRRLPAMPSRRQIRDREPQPP